MLNFGKTTAKHRIMKRIVFLFLNSLLVMSCNSVSNEENSISIADYKNYGAKVVLDNILDPHVMEKRYQTLKKGDTLSVSFVSTVHEVCTVKGCWMKLVLPSSEVTSVHFKDYGFFVPKDLKKAFVKELSVEEQQHIASDAGKNAREITAITGAKNVYYFIADGVLIKK